MLNAFSALLPILLTVVLGWFIAHRKLLDDHQWAGFETLAYQVFFPSIIIHTLVRADFSAMPTASLGLALLLAVLTMTALSLALRPLLSRWLGLDGPAFTSILQGATRWNTLVAMALGAGLFGQQGLALMAIAMVAMIPVLNLINVTALAAFAGGKLPSPLSLAKTLAFNPFIWSCAAGLALNLAGLTLPKPAMDTLELLGRAALAAGVLAVGGGLDLGALRRPGLRLTVATVLRLIGMPLLAAGFCALLGVEGPALGVAIIATAVPSASGAYLLARKMGGDARLMAEILTLQTIAAMLTFPVMMVLLGP